MPTEVNLPQAINEIEKLYKTYRSLTVVHQAMQELFAEQQHAVEIRSQADRERAELERLQADITEAKKELRAAEVKIEEAKLARDLIISLAKDEASKIVDRAGESAPVL